MRLIELYTRLNDINLRTNSTHNETEDSFIKNYNKLRILEAELNINFSDSNIINQVIIPFKGAFESKKFPEVDREIHNINAKLHLLKYLLKGVLSDNTSQKPNTINIKLQNDLGTFEDFNNTISTFNGLFKKLSIIDYKIVGVDKGSNWLEIIINETPTLAFLIAVVYGTMEIRKSYYEGSYYKSLEKKVNLETAIKQAQEYKNNQDLDYKDKNIRRIISVQDDLDDIVENIIENNPEHSKKINGSHKAINDAIIKISSLMEQDIEIHPSLTPPEWLKKDEDGLTSIDYEAVKKLIKKETKQIEHKESSKVEDKKQ